MVGRLVKLSMSLTDPTDVLDVLQNSSVHHLTLGMTALRYMVRNVVKCSFYSIHLMLCVRFICFVLHCLQTQQDQQKLRTLLAGMKSEQVSVVFQHSEWQFPYHSWIDPRISPGLPETLCVCTGLSENPHIRGAKVSGVPLCLLSEVKCLFKNSCHSITVNGESLHQVEPSDNQNSDEEYVCVCTYHCESHASHMYAAAPHTMFSMVIHKFLNLFLSL